MSKRREPEYLLFPDLRDMRPSYEIDCPLRLDFCDCFIPAAILLARLPFPSSARQTTQRKLNILQHMALIFKQAYTKYLPHHQRMQEVIGGPRSLRTSLAAALLAMKHSNSVS